MLCADEGKISALRLCIDNVCRGSVGESPVLAVGLFLNGAHSQSIFTKHCFKSSVVNVIPCSCPSAP